MKKYKIVVVDDHRPVLNALVDMLRRKGFEAQGFDEAEKLLVESFDACFPPREPPDLVLIDLQLKQRKMQGMALVSELTARKNVDSAIMVMSGNLTNADLVEAIKLGAGAGAAKPFDSESVIPTMERLAEMARRRRRYRTQQNGPLLEPDSSRLHRPVFLSYSGKDVRLANGLRRNIEARGIPVWYAPTTIAPGDPWKARVEAGIGDARIFVALVTDNYLLASRHCLNELMQFQGRVKLATEPKGLILPVLSDLSNRGKRSDAYQQIIDQYQCIDISDQFIDGLTALLIRIESFLAQTQGNVAKSKARPALAMTGKNNVLDLPPHSEKAFSD